MIDFQPCSDHIWIEPDDPKTTRGGLHLPDAAEKGVHFPGTATVLGVGPGPWMKGDQQIPMPCKKGDRILCTIYAHNCFKPRDKDLCFIAPDQVVAVVNGEPEFN